MSEDILIYWNEMDGQLIVHPSIVDGIRDTLDAESPERFAMIQASHEMPTNAASLFMSVEEAEERLANGDWQPNMTAEDVAVRRPRIAEPVPIFIPDNRHGRRKAARVGR